MLAEAAEKIINEEEYVKRKILDPGYIPSNDVNVAFATGFLSYLTPDFWEDFRRNCHDVNLCFTEYNDIETDLAVREGTADIGFQSEPVDYTAFDAFLFERLEAFGVMSADHPLAGYDSISYRDLNGCSICIMDSQYNSYNIHMNNLASAGSEPKDVYLIRDTSSILDYALHSDIVGITPGVVAETFSGDIAIVPFEPKLYWNIFVTHRKGKLLSNGARALLQYVYERRPVRQEMEL